MQKFCQTEGLLAQYILLILKDILFVTKKLFTTVFTSINFRLNLPIPIGLVWLVLYSVLPGLYILFWKWRYWRPLVNSHRLFFYNRLRLSNIKILDFLQHKKQFFYLTNNNKRLPLPCVSGHYAKISLTFSSSILLTFLPQIISRKLMN